MSGAPILALRGVHAGYDGISVLHGVDLQVAPGQVVALLGPNGAGKSTTIKVASGQIRPTAGSLWVAGHDVTGVGPDALARVGLCTIPEGRGVFPNLTVRDNLLMASYRGQPRAEIEDRAYARFPRLAQRRDQLAGTMSGGEQQMLAMARGLATEPSVLLLDELSMGLAPIIVAELYRQVAAIAEEGVSVLVVEQFARTVLGVADVAVVLVHGQVRHVGPADAVDDEVLATTYLGATS